PFGLLPLRPLLKGRFFDPIPLTVHWPTSAPLSPVRKSRRSGPELQSQRSACPKALGDAAQDAVHDDDRTAAEADQRRASPHPEGSGDPDAQAARKRFLFARAALPDRGRIRECTALHLRRFREYL